MAVNRTVLVVAPTPSIGRAVAASAKRNGYQAVVVRTFAEAKKHLRGIPDLLVTELKLGEYNGLHLALRAATTDTPAIIVSDISFEHEVEQFGASWIAPESVLAGDDIAVLMTRLLQGAGAARTLSNWYESDRTGTTGASWTPVDSPILH
jgi:CheY-like chemotaxis protein